MASACVNNNVGLLFDSTKKSYDWFNPRSPSPPQTPTEAASAEAGVEAGVKNSASTPSKSSENLIDLEFSDDFEFRIEKDPVKIEMISADELFADGKLVPLHVSTARLSVSSEENGSSGACSVEEILKSRESGRISSGMDPYLFSPKAPRCSSGWRELLGLKKLQQTAAAAASSSSSRAAAVKSLKHQFGHKTPKKSDHSLGQPLLSESESEIEKAEPMETATAISPGRDLPRISLDSHKSTTSRRNQNQNQNQIHHHPPPKVRLVRRIPDPNTTTSTHQSTQSSSVSASASALGVSIDSPRMNSSGKVVFQSLERSSSSPSTFNGGPRIKYKGMERRSYSANVKVSPVVLNVPVCSLRGSSKFGLGQLFPSPHKKPDPDRKKTDSERSRIAHHGNKQKQPLS